MLVQLLPVNVYPYCEYAVEQIGLHPVKLPTYVKLPVELASHVTLPVTVVPTKFGEEQTAVVQVVPTVTARLDEHSFTTVYPA